MKLVLSVLCSLTLSAVFLFQVPLNITSIPAGADLQAAINAAATGDTLQLADATYVGNFIDNKGVTIRGPAQLVSPNADPAISYPPMTPPAALVNLELYSTAPQVFTILRYGSSDQDQNTFDKQPQGLTIDSCNIHGLPLQESQRAIAANGRNFKLLNSRVWEIHGKGYDTQAVCAWNGSGPFQIIDSYLEAAGENVMFGGARAWIPNLIPSDIEIRNSHLFKPLSWKIDDPSYAGQHWTIKNLLELKNARNVVIDNCLLENSWPDAQVGYAMLFTVRSEDGTMPWATIQNVTVTNSVIRNAFRGVTAMGKDYGAGWESLSVQAVGLSFYNVKFEDLKDWLFILHDYDNITLEHVSSDAPNAVFVFTGFDASGQVIQSQNFIYRNNASYPSVYGFKADGAGEGTSALNLFCNGWAVEGSVIAGEESSLYPAGNFYPVDLSALSSFIGTDGLTPGYLGSSSPTPTPTPTASPTPSPTPCGLLPNGRCKKPKPRNH